MASWSVYDIIEDGTLVYVGYSSRPSSRFKAHRWTGVAGPTAAMEIVAEYGSLIEAMAAERERIMDKCPPRNRVHNVRKTYLPPPKKTPLRQIVAANLRIKKAARNWKRLNDDYVAWLETGRC